MGIFTERDARTEQTDSAIRSNLPLLVIAAGFLAVTILLVALQPYIGTPPDTRDTATVTPTPHAERSAVRAPQSTAAIPPQTEPAPVAAPPSPPSEDVVTRASVPLLNTGFTPIERVTSAAIAEKLRQPIRLINVGTQKRDLPSLVDETLVQLSPDGAAANPALKDLLVHAISEKQSDAYIRELVNLAHQRDGLQAPPTLRTTDGTLDTYSLLKAMALSAGMPMARQPDQVDTSGTQKIVPGDSLARLALRYYGQPLKYEAILTANPQIDPQNPILRPGDVIQMPKP